MVNPTPVSGPRSEAPQGAGLSLSGFETLAAIATNDKLPVGARIANIDYQGEKYVVFKSTTGARIQKLNDWHAGLKTGDKTKGIFVSKGGDRIVPPGTEKESEALESWIKTLEKNANTLKSNPQAPAGYVISSQAKTKIGPGTVFQKQEDFTSNKVSGLFLSDTGALIFDGDPECLKFFEQNKITPTALQNLPPPQATIPKEKGSITATKESTTSKIANIFKRETGKPEGVAATAKIAMPSGKERVTKLIQFWETNYQDAYLPDKENKNRTRFLDFVKSDKYETYAKTARVYFNGDELSQKDSKAILSEREPTVIGRPDLKTVAHLSNPNSKMLNKGIFFTTKTKENGEPFSAKPHTVAVYSETRMWQVEADPANKLEKKKERDVSLLSLPAPALDVAPNPDVKGQPSTQFQPHFPYYVTEGKLDAAKYQREMEHLARTVVTSFADNKDAAFEGKGINRLVLSPYGQGIFLFGLSDADKEVANRIFYETLTKEIVRNKGLFRTRAGAVTIAMSVNNPTEKSRLGAANKGAEVQERLINVLAAQGLKAEIISGDIAHTANDRDMIVNPWDPHSIPGNGHKGDKSFDGRVGDFTAIAALQYPEMNPYLNDPARYVSVRAETAPAA